MPTPNLINILLAYPKALTGNLISDTLSRQPGFRVAAHVASPDPVLAFTKHTEIDVALIYVDLGSKGGGLDVLRRLRTESKDIRAVMLFDTPDSQMVVDAFRLGAKGVFCMSSYGFDLVCKCIQCVHDGQIWANAQELHWVIDTFRYMSVKAASAPGKKLEKVDLADLSKREKDVVQLVADGMSNREIAQNLSLSENTIKNYMFRIFEKVGVSSRTELLLHAFRARTD